MPTLQQEAKNQAIQQVDDKYNELIRIFGNKFRDNLLHDGSEPLHNLLTGYIDALTAAMELEPLGQAHYLLWEALVKSDKNDNTLLDYLVTQGDVTEVVSLIKSIFLLWSNQNLAPDTYAKSLYFINEVGEGSLVELLILIVPLMNDRNNLCIIKALLDSCDKLPVNVAQSGKNINAPKIIAILHDQNVTSVLYDIAIKAKDKKLVRQLVQYTGVEHPYTQKPAFNCKLEAESIDEVLIFQTIITFIDENRLDDLAGLLGSLTNQRLAISLWNKVATLPIGDINSPYCLKGISVPDRRTNAVKSLTLFEYAAFLGKDNVFDTFLASIWGTVKTEVREIPDTAEEYKNTLLINLYTEIYNRAGIKEKYLQRYDQQGGSPSNVLDEQSAFTKTIFEKLTPMMREFAKETDGNEKIPVEFKWELQSVFSTTASTTEERFKWRLLAAKNGSWFAQNCLIRDLEEGITAEDRKIILAPASPEVLKQFRSDMYAEFNGTAFSEWITGMVQWQHYKQQGLKEAIKKNDFKAVAECIRNNTCGLKMRGPQHDDLPPLTEAVSFGHIETIDVILEVVKGLGEKEKQAILNPAGVSRNALYFAVVRTDDKVRPDIVAKLIAAGASVNFKSDTGETLLHSIIKKHSLLSKISAENALKLEDIIGQLLAERLGLDVNARNNAGKTAMEILLEESENERGAFVIGSNAGWLRIAKKMVDHPTFQEQGNTYKPFVLCACAAKDFMVSMREFARVAVKLDTGSLKVLPKDFAAAMVAINLKELLGKSYILDFSAKWLQKKPEDINQRTKNYEHANKIVQHYKDVYAKTYPEIQKLKTELTENLAKITLNKAEFDVIKEGSDEVEQKTIESEFDAEIKKLIQSNLKTVAKSLDYYNGKKSDIEGSIKATQGALKNQKDKIIKGDLNKQIESFRTEQSRVEKKIKKLEQQQRKLTQLSYQGTSRDYVAFLEKEINASLDSAGEKFRTGREGPTELQDELTIFVEASGQLSAFFSSSNAKNLENAKEEIKQSIFVFIDCYSQLLGHGYDDSVNFFREYREVNSVLLLLDIINNFLQMDFHHPTKTVLIRGEPLVDVAKDKSLLDLDIDILNKYLANDSIVMETRQAMRSLNAFTQNKIASYTKQKKIAISSLEKSVAELNAKLNELNAVQLITTEIENLEKEIRKINGLEREAAAESPGSAEGCKEEEIQADNAKPQQQTGSAARRFPPVAVKANMAGFSLSAIQADDKSCQTLTKKVKEIVKKVAQENKKRSEQEEAEINKEKKGQRLESNLNNALSRLNENGLAGLPDLIAARDKLNTQPAHFGLNEIVAKNTQAINEVIKKLAEIREDVGCGAKKYEPVVYKADNNNKAQQNSNFFYQQTRAAQTLETLSKNLKESIQLTNAYLELNNAVNDRNKALPSLETALAVYAEDLGEKAAEIIRDTINDYHYKEALNSLFGNAIGRLNTEIPTADFFIEMPRVELLMEHAETTKTPAGKIKCIARLKVGVNANTAYLQQQVADIKQAVTTAIKERFNKLKNDLPQQAKIVATCSNDIQTKFAQLKAEVDKLAYVAELKTIEFDRRNDIVNGLQATEGKFKELKAAIDTEKKAIADKETALAEAKAQQEAEALAAQQLENEKQAEQARKLAEQQRKTDSISAINETIQGSLNAKLTTLRDLIGYESCAAAKAKLEKADAAKLEQEFAPDAEPNPEIAALKEIIENGLAPAQQTITKLNEVRAKIGCQNTDLAEVTPNASAVEKLAAAELTRLKQNISALAENISATVITINQQIAELQKQIQTQKQTVASKINALPEQDRSQFTNKLISIDSEETTLSACLFAQRKLTVLEGQVAATKSAGASSTGGKEEGNSASPRSTSANPKFPSSAPFLWPSPTQNLFTSEPTAPSPATDQTPSDSLFPENDFEPEQQDEEVEQTGSSASSSIPTPPALQAADVTPSATSTSASLTKGAQPSPSVVAGSASPNAAPVAQVPVTPLSKQTGAENQSDENGNAKQPIPKKQITGAATEPESTPAQVAGSSSNAGTETQNTVPVKSGGDAKQLGLPVGTEKEEPGNKSAEQGNPVVTNHGNVPQSLQLQETQNNTSATSTSALLTNSAQPAVAVKTAAASNSPTPVLQTPVTASASSPEQASPINTVQAKPVASSLKKNDGQPTKAAGQSVAETKVPPPRDRDGAASLNPEGKVKPIAGAGKSNTATIPQTGARDKETGSKNEPGQPLQLNAEILKGAGKLKTGNKKDNANQATPEKPITGAKPKPNLTEQGGDAASLMPPPLPLRGDEEARQNNQQTKIVKQNETPAGPSQPEAKLPPVTVATSITKKRKTKNSRQPGGILSTEGTLGAGAAGSPKEKGAIGAAEQPQALAVNYQGPIVPNNTYYLTKSTEYLNRIKQYQQDIKQYIQSATAKGILQTEEQKTALTGLVQTLDEYNQQLQQGIDKSRSNREQRQLLVDCGETVKNCFNPVERTLADEERKISGVSRFARWLRLWLHNLGGHKLDDPMIFISRTKQKSRAGVNQFLAELAQDEKKRGTTQDLQAPQNSMQQNTVTVQPELSSSKRASQGSNPEPTSSLPVVPVSPTKTTSPPQQPGVHRSPLGSRPKNLDEIKADKQVAKKAKKVTDAEAEAKRNLDKLSKLLTDEQKLRKEANVDGFTAGSKVVTKLQK